MILYRHIVFIFMMLFSLSSANSFGYLREVEASFCMDVCSQYMLEEESGSFVEYLYADNMDLSQYVNRYVEVETDGEYNCIECNASIIQNIEISDACDYPVSCFVAPCSVALPCESNIAAECVDNYCGGCHADFYDMSGNLVNCDDILIEECTDLSGIFFGWCDMFMGYAYVDGQCEGVSGCGWVVDGVDYSEAFFNSYNDCYLECADNQLTCNEIESEYENIHSGIYDNCSEDNDCVTIWGDCDVGLGGCHYSINDELFDYGYSDELVDMWLNGDCMEWVCDCMPPPNSICSNGECELTYCDGPNPAGCSQHGCGDGFECVDFGNSGYADFCVSSSCSCDENYIYQSYWMCTDDCNGGTCIPEDPETGDLCIVEESSVGSIPGFVDCDGECVDYMYYEWVGDGWCDEGAWGISLVCEALDCDGGDCPNSWCGCIAGDSNDDEIVNILDIVLIISCILDGDNTCSCSDVNHDGTLNVLDIVILVNLIIEP